MVMVRSELTNTGRASSNFSALSSPPAATQSILVRAMPRRAEPRTEKCLVMPSSLLSALPMNGRRRDARGVENLALNF